LGRYPAGYGTGYPPENPTSSGEDCLDSNPADCSADCPPNRLASSPESKPASNSENCLENNRESYSAGCLASCLGDSQRSPVNRSNADGRLLQFDDLGTETGTSFDDINAGRQRSHIIRPGTQT
jgi:hypothetical protein